MPTEVYFYHLERQPLEVALPTLIEKTAERGWRAVVEIGDESRLQPINELLWTYKPESFLPHGTKADGHASEQPVYLTTGAENPNGATVRFYVEGAGPEAFSGYDRLVVMIDGRNPDSVAAARRHWKAAAAAGADVAYWQQSDAGRWERRR